MSYSEKERIKIVDQICNYLVDNNTSLRNSIESLNLINRDTFYEWLKKYPEFADRYARACEDREDNIFEEILEIADESSGDVIKSAEGKEVFNNEYAQRSRIRIDARKWMLGKMNPTKYSDKIQVDPTPFKEQPLFGDE